MIMQKIFCASKLHNSLTHIMHNKVNLAHPIYSRAFQSPVTNTYLTRNKRILQLAVKTVCPNKILCFIRFIYNINSIQSVLETEKGENFSIKEHILVTPGTFLIMLFHFYGSPCVKHINCFGFLFCCVKKVHCQF